MQLHPVTLSPGTHQLPPPSMQLHPVALAMVGSPWRRTPPRGACRRPRPYGSAAPGDKVWGRVLGAPRVCS
eukprot:353505-Chlamydomonas_euryale.AAC.2